MRRVRVSEWIGKKKKTKKPLLSLNFYRLPARWGLIPQHLKVLKSLLVPEVWHQIIQRNPRHWLLIVEHFLHRALAEMYLFTGEKVMINRLSTGDTNQENASRTSPFKQTDITGKLWKYVEHKSHSEEFVKTTAECTTLAKFSRNFLYFVALKCKLNPEQRTWCAEGSPQHRPPAESTRQACHLHVTVVEVWKHEKTPHFMLIFYY